MVEILIKAAEAFQSMGPYFVVIVLGYAYWKREAYVKELHQQMMEISREQVETITKMDAAVTGLKEAVGGLRDLIQTLINKG